MTTIAIIDDRLNSNQILVQLVSPMDGEFDAQSFANTVEVLNWCDKHTVDLILTDYKMPEMNGIEFIQKFRQLASCEDISVIH
jgi:two-component system response regulator RpfG